MLQALLGEIIILDSAGSLPNFPPNDELGAPPVPVKPDAWSERVMAGFCHLFAAWTLCSQTVVFLGGSLWQLILLAGAVLGASLLGIFFGRRLWGSFLFDWSFPVRTVGAAEVATNDRGWIPRLVVLGTAAVAVPLLIDQMVPLWWLVTVLLAVGTVVTLRAEPTLSAPPRSGSRGEIALWSLGLICAAYSLLTHRPDEDDAFYVNIAAAAADAPHSPLFQTDTLHGLTTHGVHLPVYKLHSWELWNGAWALLFDLQALSVFHYLSAALVAVLVPLAWAALLRSLAPRHWMVVLVAVLAVLVGVGDVHRWYGNFGLVRIWQGKAVFLSVLLPLVWTYALRFGQRPTWRGAALLAATQIASVGLTSTALWAAPAAAGTALLSTVVGWRSMIPLAGFAAISTYALALGGSLRQALAGLARRAAESSAFPGDLGGYSLDQVFGTGPLQVVALVAVATTWTVAPRGLARRFAAVAPFAFWLVLFNPYLEGWMAAHLSGRAYWRLLWVLPVPLLLAFMVTAPLSLSESRSGGGGRNAIFRPPVILSTVLGLTFLFLVPREYGWSRDNGVRLGLPRYQVPAQEWALACEVAGHVPAGATVVAPRHVNTWLPVMEDRPYPLMVRGYLRLKGHARLERLGMVRLAEGGERGPQALAEFRRGLNRFDIQGVLFYSHGRPGDERMRSTVREAGFRRASRGSDWELWVREAPDPLGDPQPDRYLRFPPDQR